MRHLLNTSRGKHARTQQDLINISKKRNNIVTEELKNPLTEVGFCQYEEGDLRRMDGDVFFRAVYNLLRRVPSSLVLDVTPIFPYTEVTIYDHSPELYRASMKDRAEDLAEEFLKNPQMAGFKLSHHDVALSPTEPRNPNASVSISIYLVEEGFEPTCPVTIKVTHQPDF